MIDVDEGKFLREVPAECDHKKMLPALGLQLKANLEMLQISGQSKCPMGVTIN